MLLYELFWLKALYQNMLYQDMLYQHMSDYQPLHNNER